MSTTARIFSRPLSGDSIPAKIEEGLERSRVPVLCLSAHAFGSDWAQLESGTLRTGQRPFRDPLNQERRFLPLRDTLQQKLLSGELSVGEMNTQEEAVV